MKSTKKRHLFTMLLILSISACMPKKASKKPSPPQEGKVAPYISEKEFFGDSLHFIESAKNKVVLDSVYKVKLGDCFILKEQSFNHGFMVYEINDNNWEMLFVQLDEQKTGLESFSNGKFWTYGGEKHKYPSALSVFKEDRKIKFLSAFKKIGNLSLNKKRAEIKGLNTLLNYKLETIKTYKKDEYDLARRGGNAFTLKKVSQLINNTMQKQNTSICRTYDCLEKNKRGSIEGFLRKYTPNTSGKGTNQMFWEYELLLN